MVRVFGHSSDARMANKKQGSRLTDDLQVPKSSSERLGSLPENAVRTRGRRFL